MRSFRPSESRPLLVNIKNRGLIPADYPHLHDHGIVVYWYNIWRYFMGVRRTFKGQVHVRLSPETHEDVAKEAFEKGTSISGIVAQSLMIRRALRNIDPWKTVAEIREANKNVDPKDLQADITKAIKAVRKKARA